MRLFRSLISAALIFILAGCSIASAPQVSQPEPIYSEPVSLEQYTDSFYEILDFSFLSDAINDTSLTASKCEELSDKITSAINNAAYLASTSTGSNSIACNVGSIPEYALLAILKTIPSHEVFKERLPISITQSQDGFYVMLSSLRTGELFQALAAGNSYNYLSMRANYSSAVTLNATAIPAIDSDYEIYPPVSSYTGADTKFDAHSSEFGVKLNSGSKGNIFSAADSTVVAVGIDSSLGGYVVLRDSELYEYIYTNLKDRKVSVDDRLEKGDKLCKNTKNLQFGFYVVHRSGVYINPEQYIPVTPKPAASAAKSQKAKTA